MNTLNTSSTLSTPPFLLATAALLWAWQSGGWIHAALAALAAALLEGPRYSGKRWIFTLAELYRVSDFCVVLALALGAYLYFSYGNPRAITLLFQWLPLLLLPLPLAQAWSPARSVDLSVLFWALRRQPPRRPMTLDLSWPCFALWLLGASAATAQSSVFFAGLVALCAWALASRRPRSFPVGLWAGLLLVAVTLGYAGHTGMHRFQQWLEESLPEWLAGGTRTDPYRTSTAMGSLGELKKSDDIVLRIEGSPSERPPLLHRASYDAYSGDGWVAVNGRFDGVPPEPGQSWSFEPSRSRVKPEATRYTVHDFSPAGNPVLALPPGTGRLEQLSALGLRRNGLGAVQAERPAGFFTYVAIADAGSADEHEPATRDLRLPTTDAPLLRSLASQWRLSAASPAEAVSQLEQRFAADFTYSTYSKDRPRGNATVLADFLLNRRSGHCEYFASATVLLLRAAGIPARYATGLAPLEYSGIEGAWIARERHAHSWARAWIGGRWVDVDTTPPDWAETEAAQTAAWRSVRDRASWARFALARAFAQIDEDRAQRWGIALALAMSAVLAWRLLRRKQVAETPRAVATPARPVPGSDSAFYSVEARLGLLDRARERHETIGEWFARIEQDLPRDSSLDVKALRLMSTLHERYRFDPLGLDEASQQRLQGLVEIWLAQHPASHPASQPG